MKDLSVGKTSFDKISLSLVLWIFIFCVNQRSATAFTVPIHYNPSFHFVPSSSVTASARSNKHLLKMSSSTSTNNPFVENTVVTSQDDMQQAKALISKAISAGAPAYNAGDIEGCARIYKSTASQIAPLLSMPLKVPLEEEIALQNDNNDNMEVAWAFRRQFDTIMEYEPPFLPASSSPTDTHYKLEKFTPQQLPEQPWNVMDNVMGGVSQGQWVSNTNTFVGTTSLANNGGFASLRWRFPTLQNWSYAKGIYFRNVKHSQPSKHTFRLLVKDTTCEQIRGANFKVVFANPQEEESESIIYIPFTAFTQMEQMGRQLSGPIFNPSAVSEIGIMAIKPSVVGDFELTIPEWGLYTPDNNPHDDGAKPTSQNIINDNVTVKVAAATSDNNDDVDSERLHCVEIRRKVFIEEQQVPQDREVDGKDDEAIHIIAYSEDEDGNSVPCGTARLLVDIDAEGSKIAKIGRVAVLKDYRSKGIGRQIMQYSIQHLKSVVKCQKAKLGAQTYAIPFYESLGFTIIEDVQEYIDGGTIPHRDMEQVL